MIKSLIMVTVALGSAFFFIKSGKTENLNQTDNPIVLEMFTSQSCSSCPPADKVLGQLEQENKNVIALSCNVTYWNHLHWEDTLSKEFCSTRQRQYVRTLRSRGPYTPQVVVNGTQTMVGSRGGQIRHAINTETATNPVKLIDLNISDDQLIIKLPEIASDDSFALNLVQYKHSQSQSIPSGENRGRNVHYTNPVEKVISLGSWDGTSKTVDYDISELKNAKGLALLAQKNGVTGDIVAANKIEF